MVGAIDWIRRQAGSFRTASDKLGLFVDGPNVLREEFDVDLDDVRAAARRMGTPSITRLYLDEHATPGLIQAAEARGFEVVVTSGDVDVKLAIDSTEAIVDGSIDLFAIATRDTDFKPLLELAARRGVETVVITPGSVGRSDAIVNAAHSVIALGEDETDTGSDSMDSDPIDAN